MLLGLVGFGPKGLERVWALVTWWVLVILVLLGLMGRNLLGFSDGLGQMGFGLLYYIMYNNNNTIILIYIIIQYINTYIIITHILYNNNNTILITIYNIITLIITTN